VTNPPTGWEKGEEPKGSLLAALLILAETVDAGQRSPDAVFWWRCHVLDIACAWDNCDSLRCGPHRAHAPSHHARGVAPVDRAWLLADNAACHQAAGESPVPQNFLFALHVPTVEERRRISPEKDLGRAGSQFEGGENSVRRIEVGCHC
jgi:hypothetical protein